MTEQKLKKGRLTFRKIYPRHENYESVLLGILLAIVGGILEVYTYLGRGGVFCNAQTGNIALLGISVSAGDWRQALVYVPPIIAFILGVIVAETMKRKWSFSFISEPARAVLILEALILFVIGFIPSTAPNIIVTVTISFVSSVQVSAFRTLVDSPYATTVLTGNLRVASAATYRALTEKNTESAIKAIRFITIIIAFIFGTIVGGTLMLFFDVKAIWSAVFLLICCFSLDYFY